LAFSFSTRGVEDWSVSTSSRVALVLVLCLGNLTTLQCFLALRGMEFRGLNCGESFES